MKNMYTENMALPREGCASTLWYFQGIFGEVEGGGGGGGGGAVAFTKLLK